MPLFSILSTADVDEAYLAEMVASVRAQTLDDWELIIAGGAPSDDPRIRSVPATDESFGAAINAAAAVATGELFTVVKGNHKLAPEFCERTAAALGTADVIAVDAFGFTDSGEVGEASFRRAGGVETEPGVGRAVSLAEFVGGSVLYYSAAIKRAAWELGGGYPVDRPMVEGLVLFARMLAAGSDIRVLPEPLAAYRVPEDLATFAVFEDTFQDALIDIGRMTDDPAVQAAADEKLRTMRFHQSMRKARAAIAASDPAAARRHVKHALQQRRALKPAAIYAVLAVAPGSFRTLQRVKQRIR